jgi:predicted secreted protein
MAEKAIAGTSGNFSIGGHKARIAAWSASFVQDVNDASGFASAGWRENLGGMKVMRGEASGYLTYDAASTAPVATITEANDVTGQAFTLTCVTGCTYGGTAIVSNVVVGHSISGNASVSFSFVSTGAVTETWDVAP